MALGLDAASSVISQSPMNKAGGGLMSSKFKQRMGMGGIATPLGSDMSMKKFDFSGYDPQARRKKQAAAGVQKVLKREEDDMEVFVTDYTDNPDQGNWDKKNERGAQQAKEKVMKEIYEVKQDSTQVEGSQTLLAQQIDVMTL